MVAATRPAEPADDLADVWDALDALPRASAGAGLTATTVELVAVDSGSEDGTLALLREYRARIVHTDPADFDFGRNRDLAYQHARGEFVVNLSQDAVPAHAQNTAEPAVALQGMDVVSYFKDGGPVKGQSAHRADFDGARYLFSSAQNRAAFLPLPPAEQRALALVR